MTTLFRVVNSHRLVKKDTKMAKQISQKQQLILDQIVPQVTERLAVDPAEVTLDASFVNDLGADSLDLVELMMEFEKMFHLSIPDDKQEAIQTVGDVVFFVEQNRTGKPENVTKTTTPTKTVAKVPGTPKKKSETANQTKKTTTVKPREKTSPQDLLEMKVKEVFEMPMGDVIRLMMQLRQIQK